MRRVKFGAMIVICVLVAGKSLIVRALFGGGDGKASGQQSTCLANVHLMAQGVLMYASDNDGLPLTSNWMDGSEIFVVADLAPKRAATVFHCPGLSAIDRDNAHYGYAMQMALGGIKLSLIQNPSSRPMIFDSSLLGRNAASEQVVEPGFARHGGQMFGYVDGHVTRFKVMSGLDLK